MYGLVLCVRLMFYCIKLLRMFRIFCVNSWIRSKLIGKLICNGKRRLFIIRLLWCILISIIWFIIKRSFFMVLWLCSRELLCGRFKCIIIINYYWCLIYLSSWCCFRIEKMWKRKCCFYLYWWWWFFIRGFLWSN